MLQVRGAEAAPHGPRGPCPSLTGLGDRAHVMSADIDLDTHIRDIVQLIAFEDLTRVILVGHSYGGMVITGVADRVPERIGHRVYLDAAYPTDGESLHDHAHEAIEGARRGLHEVDGVPLVMAPHAGMAAFFGVTDPELGAWTDARLTAHPWKCFEQKLTLRNEAAMRATPESHLICTSTIPGRAMEQLHTRAGTGMGHRHRSRPHVDRTGLGGGQAGSYRFTLEAIRPNGGKAADLVDRRTGFRRS
ncbi:alpha/beta fold hydrolase [Novosphingobium panipatense]